MSKHRVDNDVREAVCPRNGPVTTSEKVAEDSLDLRYLNFSLEVPA
jgi:hypothetical protein